MKISSLQPQFTLKSSHSGDAAQERRRSRDSGHHSERDPQSQDRNSNDRDQKAGRPSPNPIRADAPEPVSNRSSGTFYTPTAHKPFLTTADLAAALTPERFLALELETERAALAAGNLGNLAKHRLSKEQSKADPVADVLRRLAFQTAEETFRKGQALAAYAKIRDAINPPALPSLAKLNARNEEQAALSAARGSRTADSVGELADVQDASFDSALGTEDLASSSPVSGIVEGNKIELALQQQALIALKAFHHIDFAA